MESFRGVWDGAQYPQVPNLVQDDVTKNCGRANYPTAPSSWTFPKCPSSGSYHVLHLEVLDQVEVNEHADGSQCGFCVGQLKVAKAEVQKSQ